MMWLSLLWIYSMSIRAFETKDPGKHQLPLLAFADCSNSTHRWLSFNGSCFDEDQGPIPYLPPKAIPDTFGRYLANGGLYPRDGLCGPEETTCWIVNCCQAGETCGPINVGCQISWSTIYTTTITTSRSTITSLVVPTVGVDFTTVTVNSTTFITSFQQITLPGEGLDEVIETAVISTSILALSAYTPPPITITETVTREPEVTQPPQLMLRRANGILPRADIPRRSARTSYKTVTVWVTTFFTDHATSTLSDSVLEYTETATISSIATRNQTHYETPTGFTTLTITSTSMSTSYAFGSVDAPTRLFYVTTYPSPIVAGKTPTTSAEQVPMDAEAEPRKISSGAIAGIVVGIILALVILALVVGMLICLRRKRRRQDRDDFDETPSPPRAPTPIPNLNMSQSSMVVREDADSPMSPISPIFATSKSGNGNGNGNGVGYHSRHARKGSRVSVVSITPVPEEDEDEITPVQRTDTRNSNRRNSNDSGRSWGKGYGGRGGYRNSGDRHGGRETDSPTNPAFRGATISSYSDESLVPPHARDQSFRFH